MRVRIGVMFRSVFYAPFFVSLHGGFFEREGLEPEAQILGNGRLVVEGLRRGDVDVGIGGIMRSLEGYDRGEDRLPVHFARINDRDGFFLLGREPAFDWPDLIGRRLLLFAEASTPWYNLRALLRDRGLDPDQIIAIGDRPVDQVAAAFRAGEADFLVTPAPVAEELIRDGSAVILREMATETGPLPYSSYSARPETLDQRPDLISAVARAHVRTLAWLREAGGAAIWEAIRPSFDDGDPEILRPAVERYFRLGVWHGAADLPRDVVDRLADRLHKGGLIERIAPYELVCRDDLTRRAMGTDLSPPPPPLKWEGETTGRPLGLPHHRSAEDGR